MRSFNTKRIHVGKRENGYLRTAGDSISILFSFFNKRDRQRRGRINKLGDSHSDCMDIPLPVSFARSRVLVIFITFITMHERERERETNTLTRARDTQFYTKVINRPTPPRVRDICLFYSCATLAYNPARYFCHRHIASSIHSARPAIYIPSRLCRVCLVPASSFAYNGINMLILFLLLFAILLWSPPHIVQASSRRHRPPRRSSLKTKPCYLVNGTKVLGVR